MGKMVRRTACESMTLSIFDEIQAENIHDELL